MSNTNFKGPHTIKRCSGKICKRPNQPKKYEVETMIARLILHEKRFETPGPGCSKADENNPWLGVSPRLNLLFSG